MGGGKSSPADREAITSLLGAALHVPEDTHALEPRFQQWKYWDAHPLLEGARSHTCKRANGDIVAHGCVWPIQLSTQAGTFQAFHLIDWAAQADAPGAGMQVLRQCSRQMAAAFSIGGSAMTKKILPAFGFKTANRMNFLRTPLRPLLPALRESSVDWKTPARLLHNLYQYLYSSRTLPKGWRMASVQPGQIPGHLWPAASTGTAVGIRSSPLLSHLMSCPTIHNSACGLLTAGEDIRAYVFLVQVGDQVRMVDYGPAELSEETSHILGCGAQALAASLFPTATNLTVATSEEPSRAGFLRAGFHLRREEPIKVLRLDKSLNSIEHFRLTLLDWDACCL
jgi:hypothetical protein